MSWVRVGGVQHNRANLPATSLDVPLFHSVEAGDLVIVGVVTDAHQDSFALGDNSPSGSNSYNVDVIGDNPPGTATVSICSSVMNEHVLSLVVTVANGDGGSNRIGGIIAGYRTAGQVFVDGFGFDSGTGSAIGPISLALPFLDELVVAMAVAEPSSSVMTFFPPMSLQQSVFPGALIGGYYADDMGDSGTVRVAGVLPVPADWALASAFYSIGIRPKSSPPSSFFGGGTQPAPVYRMQGSWGRHWIGPQRRCRFSKLIK